MNWVSARQDAAPTNLNCIRHVWKVVEVANVPVAIGCRVCDSTWAIGKPIEEEGAPPEIAIDPGQRLSLRYAGSTFSVTVEGVQIFSEIGRPSSIEASFRTRPHRRTNDE